MTTAEKIITARARAFSGQRIRTHKFMVSAGMVRVWDSIAGHYTTCHSLSPAATRRILRLAGFGKLGSINGSAVRSVYRGTQWTRELQVRLFVTEDGKIWLGYGELPENFSHVANVGDRGTEGTSRAAIRRAANA